VTVTVAFYVKAGQETGYGHIVRCLALADELRARGCNCAFIGNAEIAQRVGAAGFSFYVGSGQHFDEFYLDTEADVWIVDLEGGCSPDLAARLVPRCRVFCILNGVGYPDGDPGRLLADLVFYQGRTDRPRRLQWPGFEGDWFEGTKWLILRKDFQSLRAQPGTHDPPRVVVAGGGSDPKDVTGLALRALEGEPYSVRAIIGPANSNGLTFDPFQVDVVHDPDDMADVLVWADVAVVSYGMTAFECLALGLPVVALSISEDHAESARLVGMGSLGALFSLGEVEYVSVHDVRWAVDMQLGRHQQSISKMARAYCDGRGAALVAGKILETLEAKR